MSSPVSVSRLRPCARRLLLCALTGAALLAALPGSASADCAPIQCAKPDAATGPATNISSTGATLNGTVNSHGTSTGTWRFEIGTNDANMTVVASGVVPEKDENLPVSFNATGLAPGTNYQYRVTITTSWPNGPVSGGLASFGTPLMGSPPAATPPAPPAPAVSTPVAPSQFTAGSANRVDARSPFAYHVRGRVVAPAGVTDFCHGSVTIRFKRGATTVLTRTAQLRQLEGICRYDENAKLSSSRLDPDEGTHSLRVTAAFAGNEKLKGAIAPAFRVSYVNG